LEAGSINIGVYVASSWESIIQNTQAFLNNKVAPNDNHDHLIHYFVSDDAGQCGKARRVLALRYPGMIFMMCWAHQVNLMVSQIIQRAGIMETLKKVNKAVNALNASSSKFLPYLRDKCRIMYGSKAACSLIPMAETRWNSCQGCLASILRIRQALRVLSVEYMETPGFHETWVEFASKEFWTDVQLAEVLIRPMCQASFLMQREANTLADIVLMLMNMWIHVSDMSDLTAGNGGTNDLGSDITRRWDNIDQPLCFLAFALHPLHAATARKILRTNESEYGNWGDKSNPLCTPRLAHAAKTYFLKFQLPKTALDEDGFYLEDKLQDEVNTLGLKVKQWLMGRLPMPDPFNPAKDDSVLWWGWQSCEEPILANFAMFLLSCPVQSASCERVFKNYSAFHTKKRNHLGSKKTYRMTKIKYYLDNKYKDPKGANGNKNNTQRKNKSVVSDEHIRIVQQKGGDLETSEESSDGESEDKKKVENDTGDGDEDHMNMKNVDDNSEGDSDSEDSGNEYYDDNVVDGWVEAFGLAKEEPDEDEEYDEDKDDDNNENSNENDVVCDGLNVLAFEVIPKPQEPWPDWDNWDRIETYKNWPQENKAHFKRMKKKFGESYVRTDKYKLSRMVECFWESSDGENYDWTLPCMESAYGANYN
jgi:hypothetical protein